MVDSPISDTPILASEGTQRCGFVAVLGQPNAGKSTLVNYITGHKVSIVTPKVQTTRRRVLGIQMYQDTQLILIDTPGLFRPHRAMEKAIVAEARKAQRDADVLLYLVDVTQKNLTADQEYIAACAKKAPTTPCIVAFNKIDRVAKEKLLTTAALFNQQHPAVTFAMVSAITGSGVDDLVNMILPHVPSGPWLFDADQVSDAPQKLWATEITREQVFLQLDHELPYETFVETDSYNLFDNGSIKICQSIVVAKSSQKAIVLGAKGQRIKAISMKAKQELERVLQCTVHLFLFVKVEEEWMNKPRYLRELFE